MALITRKKKVVLSFREDEPEVYKLDQVVIPQIKFDDLQEDVAARCGVPQAQTQAVVTGMMQSIAYHLKIGHPVSLGTLGSLSPVMNVKTTKKPEDVDETTITNLKVRFYPGSALKSAVKKGGVTYRKALNGEGCEDND